MPQSLASIPYGQYESGELSEEHIERVGAFWKRYWAKPDASASQYPSFEMWAAMTSYDRDADDGTGGEGFQNLMRLLLCGATHANSARVQNTSSKLLTHISKDYVNEVYWNCETQQYGRMFKTTEGKKEYGFETFPPKAWYDDELGNAPALLDNKPSSTHSSAHCRPFEEIHGLGLQRGAVSQGKAIALFNNFGTRFGYYPCSMFDFLVKANMKVIADGKSAKSVNNVSQSYKNVGIGPNAREDCWEIGFRPDGSEPCMLAMNKIAAYFGMYYYTDCRHESLNWFVHQKIDDTIFEIQMRAPNPMYGKPNWFKKNGDEPFERGKLFVREPLNPMNKEALENYTPVSKSYEDIVKNKPNFKLKEERNFDHIGGKNPGDTEPESKFEVPRINKKATR